MITNSEEHLALQLNLLSLNPFGRLIRAEKWFINLDPVTLKRTSLQSTLEQETVFSRILIRRCLIG